MLENIKMILSITDTSKDAVLNYWIGFYSKMVLAYTHQPALNADLEAIIEQVIVLRAGGTGIVTEANKEDTDGIKSIERGDYKITYKDTAEDKLVSNVLDKYAFGFKGQLNLQRRLNY